MDIKSENVATVDAKNDGKELFTEATVFWRKDANVIINDYFGNETVETSESADTQLSLLSLSSLRCLCAGYCRSSYQRPVSVKDIASVIQKYIGDGHFRVQFRNKKIKDHNHSLTLILLSSNQFNQLINDATPTSLDIKFSQTNCSYKYFENEGYNIQFGIIGVPHKNIKQFKHIFKTSDNRRTFIGFDNLYLFDPIFEQNVSYYVSMELDKFSKYQAADFGKNNNYNVKTLYHRKRSTKQNKQLYALKKGDTISIKIESISNEKKTNAKKTNVKTKTKTKISKKIKDVKKTKGWKKAKDRKNIKYEQVITFCKNGTKLTQEELNLNVSTYFYFYGIASSQCNCTNENLEGFVFDIDC